MTTDQAMAKSTIRLCRNLLCQFVGNPDPREFREAEEKCPRCKTPWVQRPSYEGPDVEGEP